MAARGLLSPARQGGRVSGMARKGDTGQSKPGDGEAGRFDFGQMLAIADALPMALAFVDTSLRNRFVNQALAALAAFRDLADGDRDGRVTTYEYDHAKEFITARR